MSKAHLPPVPPAGRPKGAAGTPDPKNQQDARPQDNVPQNQGRSGDIAQNTRNQGYQQDR